MLEKTVMMRVISECKLLLNGEKTHSDMSDFILKNIKIKRYLPIMDKEVVCRIFVHNLSILDLDIIDTVTYNTQIECAYLWDVIMEAYCGIKVDDSERTYENYDILYNSEFVNIITSEFRNDFECLKLMIKNILGINDVAFVKQIISAFNTEEIRNAAKDIKDAMSDKDIINQMSNLINFNNPVYTELSKK